ncbi:hypothetical protein H6P81_002546 [Aristolochia fimbriata]|uniref:Uncharacterized protein n=1 Tax=Aristolochia fimbriata TaxID=158543 RepID=A0AAV7FAR8_ARIFI|nr:hypothetical protein H6P81_002546 [Aristolochia fimbriata]
MDNQHNSDQGKLTSTDVIPAKHTEFVLNRADTNHNIHMVKQSLKRDTKSSTDPGRVDKPRTQKPYTIIESADLRKQKRKTREEKRREEKNQKGNKHKKAQGSEDADSIPPFRSSMNDEIEENRSIDARERLDEKLLSIRPDRSIDQSLLQKEDKIGILAPISSFRDAGFLFSFALWFLTSTVVANEERIGKGTLSNRVKPAAKGRNEEGREAIIEKARCLPVPQKEQGSGFKASAMVELLPTGIQIRHWDSYVCGRLSRTGSQTGSSTGRSYHQSDSSSLDERVTEWLF